MRHALTMYAVMIFVLAGVMGLAGCGQAPQGSAPTSALTDPLLPAGAPSASGTRPIAYYGAERLDGSDGIYKIGPAGGTPVHVSGTANPDLDPSWSPQHDRLAVASYRLGHWEIWVINANGSFPHRLTHSLLWKADPAWSPDGNWIAYQQQSGQGEGSQIAVINADGGDPVVLTHAPGLNNQPTWSPDSARIAFASDRATPVVNSTIYLMNANGTGLRRLWADHGAYGYQPAWSPNGHLIAFVWAADIYLARPSHGAIVARLTKNAGTNSHPTWSPDGSRIAFCSDRGGSNDIWVMNADGSHVQRLTDDPSRDESPDWW